MNIGLLLSRDRDYSIEKLIEAAQKRGHSVRVIHLAECFVKISQNDPQVHYRGGEHIANLDAIIPRIYPEMTFFGTAVLRQFELIGFFPLNNSMSILRSRDKLRSLQILAKNGLPMPVTGFAHSPQDTDDVIKSVGGAPLVIKLIEGTRGHGVVLAETHNAAKSVVNAFKELNANILVQEFIEEASGVDIRCVVLGNKVIAAMERTAQKGEFRANVHLGARVKEIKITPEERLIAVNSARVLGLDIAGVDILRSKRGPLILEVNSSLGLKGIENATGKDIAMMMIEYVEKNARPYTKRHTA
jgi:ribosomal protein S6--L-glutamate ligase